MAQPLPPAPPPPRRPGSRAWALAFAVVAVTVVLAGAALWVFHSLRSLPGDAVREGRQVLRDLESIAAAFRQGTIEVRFLSYATRVNGTSYLQFATVEQTEVFRRTDRATALWGVWELPDVVVEATAPVEYTYYLDLDEEWRFFKEGDEILVVAPRPRFNKPAIDASEIRYEVREASLFRRSDEAIANLKEGLTRMSRQRARDNLELVREMGRRKVEEFVTNWLLNAFGDGGEYHVEVLFADEEEARLLLGGEALEVREGEGVR